MVGLVFMNDRNLATFDPVLVVHVVLYGFVLVRSQQSGAAFRECWQIVSPSPLVQTTYFTRALRRAQLSEDQHL